ncbi:putative ribonuclease H protein [Glycine soja]
MENWVQIKGVVLGRHEWKDDGISLMEKYPRLYNISQQQNQYIQMGSTSDTGWECQFQWRRFFLEGKIDMVANFMQDIEGLIVQMQRQDVWSWEGDSSGGYTVGSAYWLLDRDSADENQDAVFTTLWKLKVPSKASVFSWRLIRDKLPTKSNLRSRNVEISDVNCPFCSNHVEDASHLFFSCVKIMPLWWVLMSWLNIAGVFPKTPRDHFLQHSYCNLKGIIRLLRWQIWWISLTWCIWHHRNRIVFSNDSFKGHKLMEDAIFFCWSWLKNLEKGFHIPFPYWSSKIRDGFCARGGISL